MDRRNQRDMLPQLDSCLSNKQRGLCGVKAKTKTKANYLKGEEENNQRNVQHFHAYNLITTKNRVCSQHATEANTSNARTSIAPFQLLCYTGVGIRLSAFPC